MFIIRHIKSFLIKYYNYSIVQVFSKISDNYFVLSYIIDKFCFVRFLFLVSQLIIMPERKRRESPPAPVAKPCDGSASGQPALLVPTNLFDPTLSNLNLQSREAVSTH